MKADAKMDLTVFSDLYLKKSFLGRGGEGDGCYNSSLNLLQNGMPDMAKECLKMFFMKPPPANQFLCRAYLCQAQLLAPTATLPEQLEKAVVYLLKAISFAKENTR